MSCRCGERFVSASSVGSHTDTSWQAGQAAFADAWLWCSWCRPRTFTYPFCHSAFSEYRSGVGSTGYPTYCTGNIASLKSFEFSFSSTEHTAGGKPAMRLHTAGASTPSAEMDGSCVAELTQIATPIPARLPFRGQLGHGLVGAHVNVTGLTQRHSILFSDG